VALLTAIKMTLEMSSAKRHCGIKLYTEPGDMQSTAETSVLMQIESTAHVVS